ncbi:hypothetical protein [Nocardioides nitrophenolicus]|uniref:hypothetical protein n=1 Tax=Nocardioides nitrophenolicus TaxID=60489 RepID=UPI00195943E2|nr:hypothetical protein [Nocardioides nitrophenolicus]MBM7516293.1 hypothetical protein [Nocardioides nitrophenolicus]
MKKKLLAVGGAVAGVALAAAPALATGMPYTVAVGGSTAPSTSHPWTATSVGAINFSVRHVATGAIVNMSCTSASASGRASSGSGVVDIANIDNTTWTSCTSFAGNMAVTQTSTPWQVHGDTSAVTSAQTDNVAGHIHNIRAHVANPGCTFDVGGRSTATATPGDVPGRANATFDEANQRIVVNQTGYSPTNLVVYNVIGCIGQISAGDPANFSGTYQVTSTDGPINVVSQP